MMVLVLRWIAVIVIAFLIGKLVSKCRLPSILGWMIAGMLFGPHAFRVLSDSLLEAPWYNAIIHVLECAVGLMIGTELVWRNIKQYGKAYFRRWYAGIYDSRHDSTAPGNRHTGWPFGGIALEKGTVEGSYAADPLCDDPAYGSGGIFLQHVSNAFPGVELYAYGHGFFRSLFQHGI